MSESLATVVPLGPNVGPSAPSLDKRFESMFRDHYAFVVHSLRLLGGQERDLDDVAQDMFVTVHRRCAEYDPSRPVKAWLFSFAARFASNYRRLARHRLESDIDADALAGADARDHESYRQSQRRFVQDALTSLIEEQRVALIMHDIHGLTAPEIAEALSLPLNTVYSRVRRARKALKKIADRAKKGAGR